MARFVRNVEELLKLMREIQGEHSQEEFAKELGVTSSYVSHIYSGRRQPTAQVLSRLGITSETVYRYEPKEKKRK